MKKLLTGLILATCSMLVFGHEIIVSNAWARATVAEQKSAGVYMEILSAREAKLIKAQSEVAEKTELHTMYMEGDVMKMRPVDAIALKAYPSSASKPSGFHLYLKPGSFHIMLLGLKKPLQLGDKLPLKLTFEFANKQLEEIIVNAEVVAATAKGVQVSPNS